MDDYRQDLEKKRQSLQKKLDRAKRAKAFSGDSQLVVDVCNELISDDLTRLTKRGGLLPHDEYANLHGHLNGVKDVLNVIGYAAQEEEMLQKEMEKVNEQIKAVEPKQQSS